MEASDKEEDKTSEETTTLNEKTRTTSAADIQKALRFWTHSSMATVPAEEKIQYLKSRGLSKEDIHQVWERLAEQQESSVSSASAAPPPPSNTPTDEHYSPFQQQSIQQQSIQQQQQYPQHYTQPVYQESQPESSAMDIPALLAIGGALGLTAAAAVRWLNGGDFCLLPPPTRREKNNSVVNEEARNVADTVGTHDDDNDKVVEKEEDYEQDELLVETDESSQPLDSDSMQQVMDLLESHFAKQEGMLQKISNHTTKQVTDQSMSLLRNHGSTATSNNGIQQELANIKMELQKLSMDGNRNDSVWEKQLEECLTQLQECMKQVTSEASTASAATANLSQGSTPVTTGLTAPMGTSSAFEPQSTPIMEAPPMPTEGSKSCMHILLREAIRILAEQNDPIPLRAGAQLLYLYVINLSSHPHVPRYRKIFTTNESFQKIKLLKGARELLLAVGFEENGNCLEWQGGSDDCDIRYLKEAAAALSILKSCGDDSTKQLSMNALSVLRPSTPPPVASASALQTPIFIASPPTTKKHPLLDESGGEDSILDMSNASEKFESRLESLAQPVIMDDVSMFGGENDEDALPKTSLLMRESDDGEEEEEDAREDAGFESASEDVKDESSKSAIDDSGETAELSS